jgi:hypothetical protein
MAKPNSTDDVVALSLVGPIMTAYNAAEEAGASALGFALECGQHLNSAMETVESHGGKGKGKWKKWREKNLPTVSEETERLYRRLAKAHAMKEDFFANCRSIRDAIKHLSKFDDKLNPKPPAKPKAKGQTGSTATAQQPTSTATDGLEGELKNADADEIISGLGHDTDKLADLAVRSVASLSPEKVCDALISAWTSDQLNDLAKRMNHHLSTLTHRSIPPPNELGVSVDRRI